LTSTTICGGKTRGAATPRAITEAAHSFQKEAFAPLTDDLTVQVQALADLIIVEALRGEEHDLGADDIAVR
jgi:hypothetical protein